MVRRPLTEAEASLVVSSFRDAFDEWLTALRHHLTTQPMEVHLHAPNLFEASPILTVRVDCRGLDGEAERA